MTDKVYLIHEEDYVKHIRDKDRLFWLLKRMIKQVIDLQPTRDNKELFMSAIQIGCDIDREYVSWGIPLGFSCKGTADELRELMENELIAPEEAGYYACDDTCCCQCGRLEQLMPELMKQNGVTESLKASDPMKWVGLMNNLKAQAEETVLAELIYS